MTQNRYNLKPNLNGIELTNPFPSMIEDTKDLARIFKDFKLIPYVGNSQRSFHAYVDLLEKLHLYSPTQGEITKSICAAAFGGSVIAVDSFDGFGINKNIGESGRANEFYNFLRGFNISGNNVAREAAEIYKKAKPTGNAYVLVEFIEIGNIKTVKTKVFTQKWVTKIDGEDSFLVTSDLSNINDPKGTYDIYPEFKTFGELEADEFGVKRAMFHFKHTGYENNFYAFPDTFSSIYPLFNEWQQWDGLLKESDNLFIGRLLLFFEDFFSGNAQSQEEANTAASHAMSNMTWKLNEATTAGGNSAGAITTSTYGFGTKPPTGFTLPSNTNEKWHREISEQNSKAIFGGNNWSPILTGKEQANSTLGGNQTLDVMEMFNLTTVVPEQNHMNSFLMKIFRAMMDFKGEHVDGLEVGFVTPYQQKIITENDKNIIAQERG